jgi:hypothetical protein
MGYAYIFSYSNIIFIFGYKRYLSTRQFFFKKKTNVKILKIHMDYAPPFNVDITLFLELKCQYFNESPIFKDQYHFLTCLIFLEIDVNPKK